VGWALLCRCTGISAAEVAAEAPPPDEAQFVAIWEALCDGRLPAPMGDGGSGADGGSAGGASEMTVAARHEKHVKGKLSVAADHFNRDYKKGFQYLQVPLPAAGLDRALVCNEMPGKQHPTAVAAPPVIIRRSPSCRARRDGTILPRTGFWSQVLLAAP